MANSSMQLPQPVVDELLNRLATDDTFRTLFQENTVQALIAAGASPAEADGCAPCLKVHKLADKGVISSSLADLTSMLTASMGQAPHLLKAR